MNAATEKPSRDDVVAYLAGQVAFAHRGADMVHGFLDSVGFTASIKHPRNVPPELLLELWGILQLSLWEESGLRGFIRAELPSAAAAFEDFRSRFTDAPETYCQGNSGTVLIGRVTAAWSRYCNPLAAAHLDVDIAMLRRPPGSLLDVLADLLWESRHLVQTHEDP